MSTTLKSSRSVSNSSRPAPLVRGERQRHFQHGVNIPIAFWLGLVHAGALAAPFTFTWAGLWTMLLFYWLTAGIGICLGFHRLISHRSFHTPRWLYLTIAFIGGLAGEGSALYWGANHRKHHACSDHEGDPHSPREGFWWSHTLWCLERMLPQEREDHMRRWAPDLMEDPALRFLDRHYLVWHLLLGFGMFGVGYQYGGAALGWSLVVWGMFLRMAIVLQVTWCINSVTHVWGYKTYDNDDDSRNLWWVALVTFGEGWHNNHHTYPRVANYGHRWWEFDMTYVTIRFLSAVGLVWGIAKLKPEMAAKRIKTT